MAILKKPPKQASTEVRIDDFIRGAPDAAPAEQAVPAGADKHESPALPAVIKGRRPKVKRVMKGSKEQISLTLPPELVDRIEGAAQRFGMSRTSYINRALVLALEADGEPTPHALSV